MKFSDFWFLGVVVIVDDLVFVRSVLIVVIIVFDCADLINCLGHFELKPVKDQICMFLETVFFICNCKFLRMSITDCAKF